ncbi:hypothetical protein [Nocardioides coralli]|nr:hypothetical protein [Nocardioides coralli]QZY29197.1 hypothetical protein K6T13_00225 [Nocardioides coralli]
MSTTTLAAAIIGFLLGGLTVSVAAELESDDAPRHGSGHESSSLVDDRD